MVSSFNRNFPPASVTPLELEFKAEKLMLFNRQSQHESGMQPVIQQEYKNVITHPEYVKEQKEES